MIAAVMHVYSTSSYAVEGQGSGQMRTKKPSMARSLENSSQKEKNVDGVVKW